MIKKRLMLFADSPPTDTVSFALRRMSLCSEPTMGSTPTPIANVIELVQPPSTRVVLLVESNFTWEHAVPQRVPKILGPAVSLYSFMRHEA